MLERHGLRSGPVRGWPWILALWGGLGGLGGGCAWSPEVHPTDGAAGATVQLLVAPEESGRALVAAVAGARRRVWAEMYLLTDGAALDAFAAARAGGADVRVLLEPSPYGAETANEGAFTALTQAGVDVRWFQAAGGLVHAKALLIDDRAWISTANLTLAGLDRNREYTVVDPDPGDVGRVETLWQSDAIGATPPALAVGAGRTRVVVSPIDARARLTAAIDGARASIALEVEELSDTNVIARLIAARERGVAVQVVVPAGADRSQATGAAAARLAAAGVDARATGGPGLHAKAMAIDEALAYVGSVNLTRASLDDNREVGILVVDPALARRIRDTIRGDATKGGPL